MLVSINKLIQIPYLFKAALRQHHQKQILHRYRPALNTGKAVQGKAKERQEAGQTPEKVVFGHVWVEEGDALEALHEEGLGGGRWGGGCGGGWGHRRMV